MRYHVTLGEVQRRLESRTPFIANNTLRGYHGPPREYGWLTAEWVAYILQFRRWITYTVQSYQTPIAWVMDDGRVIVPPLKHSQTTQRHVRALGVRYSPEVVYDEAVAA